MRSKRHEIGNVDSEDDPAEQFLITRDMISNLSNISIILCDHLKSPEILINWSRFVHAIYNQERHVGKPLEYSYKFLW